jgi:hypothetical protein
VVELHGVAKIIDNLLKRLDLLGKSEIVIDKCLDSQVGNSFDRISHDIHLVIGIAGELAEFFKGFTGTDRDDQSLVGDQLKVGDGVQVLGDEFVLLRSHIAAGELDKVGSELILVVVDSGLKLPDFLQMIDAQIAGHLKSESDALLGQMCHIFNSDAALLEGHGGMLEKHFLKMDSRKIFVFGLERDKDVYKLLDQTP